MKTKHYNVFQNRWNLCGKKISTEKKLLPSVFIVSAAWRTTSHIYVYMDTVQDFFITPIKTMWLNAAATDDDEVPEMMRFLMRFSRARFFCSKLFKHAVKISNILHTHYTLTNKIFHKNSCIWCWVLKFEILEVLRTNNAWDEWSRGDQQTDSKSL